MTRSGPLGEQPGQPGSLGEEAGRLAEAVLGWLSGVTAGRLPEPSPELAERLTVAVTDVAVAGAGLLRVLAEVAGTMTRPADEEPPPVERIDVL